MMKLARRETKMKKGEACVEFAKEMSLDEAFRLQQTGDKFGAPSAYICPECNGPLWETKGSKPSHYRCLAGHAFSPENLLAEESKSIEQALWTAVKMLEERANVLKRLENRAGELHQSITITSFREQAEKDVSHAKVLRQILMAAVPETLSHALQFLPGAHQPDERPVVPVALQDITQQQLHERERDDLLAQLQKLNDQLEQRVAARTEDLHRANESLRAMNRRVVEAQENERQAIARELHDEVGQALTGLTLLLNRAAQESKTESVEKAQEVVGDLLQRVRNLSVHLRPHVLDNLGLLPALRWHAKNYAQQTGLRISLQIESCEDLTIPPEAALTIFRVTQEALTNVSRHAQARSVQVQLRGSAIELQLSVEDDGRGFDVEGIRPESAGLRNMRERVELAHGEFLIESAPGHGTSLCVKLPLEERSGKSVSKQ
jgi:signal transduction histidine kinase